MTNLAFFRAGFRFVKFAFVLQTKETRAVLSEVEHRLCASVSVLACSVKLFGRDGGDGGGASSRLTVDAGPRALESSV